MAESLISREEVSTQHQSNGEEHLEANGSSPAPESNSLSASQREVLERCLHALTHAKNDSHILAALLLITRLCPASQLDRVTLHRVFEAVGFNLPARLLVTAVRGSESSGLPPGELLSLGTALLAAVSTDPDMATHPQLLSTIPLLLDLLESGAPVGQKEAQHTPASQSTCSDSCTNTNARSSQRDGEELPKGSSESCNGDESAACELDEALAADCYQVLNTICSLSRGPDQLLSRGTIPALCRAVLKKQTLSHEKGLPLLGHLLSSNVRQRAWSKHPSELMSLLASISQNFSQAPNKDRLDMCSRIPQFLPPPGNEPQTQELRGVVSSLWATLRPMVQGKLSVDQLGPVLVLSACLLDLSGWEPVGSPKFCCLVVNRACVEVRMVLEEPPGTQFSAQQQHTLTACYRIMEAAMEQACSQGVNPSPIPETAIAGLSLQQSRQVLGVLEEAFSAVIYYLQQVDQSQCDDPFVFATFRSLCAWLAEETSCLKEEVTALLPFLIGYAKHHIQERKGKGLSDWMSKISVSDCSKTETWTGEEVLRYLLPALCHLSAEDGPRKVLLSQDTPALLVSFLSRGWGVLRAQSGKTVSRDPSLETACSALLNFTVTEPDRVRTDPCFATLEVMLNEALPVLLHKSRLLVLAANCCTLGLMIGRLKPAFTGPVESSQRRFFSCALRFLLGALQASDGGGGQVRLSPVWEPCWEEVSELWRLGLQALGGCVSAQPWITTLVREEGWLQSILSLLESSSGLPDPHSQQALEEALCAIARQCPLCRQDISESMKNEGKRSLQGMTQLRNVLKN